MSNLQVHNSFQPYYAGRDSGTSRWTTRKKDGDKVEQIEVDHADNHDGEKLSDNRKSSA